MGTSTSTTCHEAVESITQHIHKPTRRITNPAEKYAQKLVFGYIQRLHCRHFPSDLVNLCLSYYLLGESFNEKLHGKHIQIVSSNKAMLNLSNASSICGTAIIDTQSDPRSIFSWTIKLYANGPSKMQLGIGILSICENIHECDFDRIINSNCFSHDQCPYYSLYTTTGYCTLDSPSYLCKVNGFNHEAKLIYNADDVKDNIIKMELNIKKKIIKYYINDQDYGIAYNQIDFTKKYHFAACLYQKNTIIEILDFEVFKDES